MQVGMLLLKFALVSAYLCLLAFQQCEPAAVSLSSSTLHAPTYCVNFDAI